MLGLGLLALRPILTPFVFGIVLAYILNPGVNWLVEHRIPRALAVPMMLIALLLSALLMTLLIIPVFQSELTQMREQLPVMLGNLNQTLSPKLKEWFGLRVRFDADSVKRFFSQKWAENSDDIVNYMLDFLRTSSGTLIDWVSNLVLIPLVTFYLLMDWHDILERIKRFIPKRWLEQTLEAINEVDRLLSQYLRGQLLVIILMAAFYVPALLLMGLDLALPIGILSGVLIFIPYIGFSVGFLLAVLAALLEFQTGGAVLQVCFIYLMGQLLEGTILTPRLVGERIGLHPVAVIFALLAFGYSLGLVGVLMALPISAAALVGLKRLRNAYLRSALFNG